MDEVIYEYGNESWGDLLTNYDGKYIVYDAIGNPLADGTWSYTWEQGRKLTKMQGSAGTWNYTYNSDGMRISRTSLTDSYSYWYDGDGRLLRMKYNDIVMSFSYSANGQPMSITYNGAVYYYLVNAQGDVVGLIDSTGVAVVQYTYDAWGRLLSTSGTAASTLGINNPLRYRGYIYDTETGLYYLQSRYYNPTWNRFVNADSFASTGQGVTGANMFAYCGSNPVCRTDCTGERYEVSWIDTSAQEEIDGNILYKTIISYKKTSIFSWLIPSLSDSHTVAFMYHITRDGVILFDNEQSGARFLDQEVVRGILAHEMYNTARTQVSGSMNGRTIKGISNELILHYKAYKMRILTKNAKESYIGSNNKKGEKGHDRNGWFFEVINLFF